MRNYIFTIQLILAALWLQSCETLDNPAPREREEAQSTYSSYSFVPASQKEVLLSETFSNNSRMWPTTFTTSQSHMYVGSGLLNIMAGYSSPIVSAIELSSFTGSTNFEIDFWMQIETSGYSGGNRLLWGYDAATKQYNFLEINEYDYQFVLGRSDGKTEIKKNVSIYSWSGYYNARSQNKFTIRKVNNMYYYFVNDTLLYQEPFVAFKGYRMGFQTGISSELNVDWLMIKKLNL